nr:uncharacterized protein LOC113728915 [Coffea arabica]
MAGDVPAPRKQYDPYSNTYNPGWRDHPNFSYGNRPQNFFPNRPPGFQQSWQPNPQLSSSNSGSSLEDIVKSLATTTTQLQQEIRSLVMSTTQFQQDTRIGMKDMETRMSQMATAINRLESHVYGKFPSLEKTKKVEKEKEFLDVFRKVEINIPLLDAIKQIPKDAKFLKDLCTHKKKLRGDEKVTVGENMSTILQRKLPSKCGDPYMFTILCKIGGTLIRKAMLDLEASINVMPKTIYASLNLGPLKSTDIIIQLADRTNAYREGLVEDVLIQVNELVFLADFYVLDMGDERSLNPLPILLGRPFLNTVRTKINVNENTLSMEFDDEIKTFEQDGKDALEVALTKHLELGATLSVEISDELYHAIEALHSLPSIFSRYEIPSVFVPETQTKLLHSVVQTPELEFKPLPKHLKHAFLGDKEILPVIISAHLSPSQEDNLVRLLQDHKQAIGWSIADIKGINPSLYMHRIRLETDAKPIRQAQRRLNPLMMEVVKKEILKLLKVGIIFAISYSLLVSPIQVVPKKAGVTVEENQEDEMVPVRKPTGWRQCIDYR